MAQIRYGTQPEFPLDLNQVGNGEPATYKTVFDAYCSLKGLSCPQDINVKVYVASNADGRMVDSDEDVEIDVSIIEFIGVAERKG